MRWALHYESDYHCLMEIIDALTKINSNQAKQILWDKIQRLKKRRYIDKRKNYPNRRFRKSLKIFLQERKYENVHVQELAEILINYLTIQRIIERFYTVFFKWENGLISELDLSEIGWNVNVWKQKYAERISDLSEIKEIQRLTQLKKLDLNNNRLSSIKQLTNLTKITHLYLSNNRLKDKKNIEYFKEFPNLKFLDIAGNEITRIIEREEMEGVYLVKRHGFGEKLNHFSILYGLYS
jgi:hypothetical protein